MHLAILWRNECRNKQIHWISCVHFGCNHHLPYLPIIFLNTVVKFCCNPNFHDFIYRHFILALFFGFKCTNFVSPFCSSFHQHRRDCNRQVICVSLCSTMLHWYTAQLNLLYKCLSRLKNANLYGRQSVRIGLICMYLWWQLCTTVRFYHISLLYMLFVNSYAVSFWCVERTTKNLHIISSALNLLNKC